MNISEIILAVYLPGAVAIFVGLVLSIRPDKELWNERLIYWSLISFSWPVLLLAFIFLFGLFVFFDLRWFLIYGVIWEKISTKKPDHKISIKGSIQRGLDVFDDRNPYGT
jgi:hypothetical protein